MTHSTASPPSSFDLAAIAANIADSKKGSDIAVLDTGTVSYLADYFVICSGDSPAQVRTIADTIEKTFRQLGEVKQGMEFDKAYRWCLLDYGDIVVHIMHRSERNFYQLEHFWNHASVVDPAKWLQPERQAS